MSQNNKEDAQLEDVDENTPKKKGKEVEEEFIEEDDVE